MPPRHYVNQGYRGFAFGPFTAMRVDSTRSPFFFDVASPPSSGDRFVPLTADTKTTAFPPFENPHGRSAQTPFFLPPPPRRPYLPLSCILEGDAPCDPYRRAALNFPFLPPCRYPHPVNPPLPLFYLPNPRLRSPVAPD